MTAPTAVLEPAPTPPRSQPIAPSTRHRGPGTKVFAGGAAVFALTAVVWGVFSLVDLLAQHTIRTSATYGAAPVVDLDVGAGGVTITPSTDGRVHVTTVDRHGLRGTTIRISREGSELVLHSRCPAALATACSIHWEVTAPPGTVLAGRVLDGSLHVRGLAAPVDVSSGDGSLTVDGATGAVVLHTGDGSIHATGLHPSSLDLHSGDGSIHASLLTVPDQITATSGDGSIELVLPTGAPAVAVEATSGDGSVSTDVRADPTASRHITAHSGDGSIDIHYP